MLKLLPFVILLLALTACTKVEKQYFPNGGIKSEVQYKRDMKNGEALYYYNNGNINIRCTYNNDKLDGLYEKFNPDGSLNESTNYKDGLKEGSSNLYFENGKIAISMNFENDLPQGEYKEYFDNGQVKIDGQYNGGFYDGEWSYYDFNGLKVGYAHFEDGSGEQIGFHYGTSKKRVSIEFENNLKNGREMYFNKEGELIKTIYYTNGEIDRVERKNEITEEI